MNELETIIQFVSHNGSALILFAFALLLFLDKFFGTVTNLIERFGIETKASLEKKHQKEVLAQQKEVIEKHTETLSKLTEILDNQNKEIQEIKKMIEEQGSMLSEQRVNMERLFSHTAELAQKLDDACDTDSVLAEGVAAILRDRIKQAHRYYKGKGGISPTGLENIEAIYIVYHDQLHKNGVGEKLYKEIKELPIKDEDTF